MSRLDEKPRKGIVLAGGSGTRLYPITEGVSKQLLPVFDKPMIYYPLSTLMLAGIQEILIITTPEDQGQYKRLLGNGERWGISLGYIKQERPDGLAQAYILAERFLNGSASAMILGDNIFFGNNLSKILPKISKNTSQSTVFGYHVQDPERYGVIGFSKTGQVESIIEKPREPKSNYAVTGFYFLDADAPELAKSIKPSSRGELEITSLLELYLKNQSLNVEKLGRGYAWLDTGTHNSLLDAGNFIRTLQKRQGLQTGCPSEIAYRNLWIGKQELSENIEKYRKSNYGAHLKALIESDQEDLFSNE